MDEWCRGNRYRRRAVIQTLFRVTRPECKKPAVKDGCDLSSAAVSAVLATGHRAGGYGKPVKPAGVVLSAMGGFYAACPQQCGCVHPRSVTAGGRTGGPVICQQATTGLEGCALILSDERAVCCHLCAVREAYASGLTDTTAIATLQQPNL